MRWMRLHIAVIGIFIFVVICTAGDAFASIEALGIVHAIHRNADRALGFIQGHLEVYSMNSRPSETAIDQIVATCNGDIHGALRALLLVNEQLEAELQQLYAAVAVGGPFERGTNALH
jgi:hypothetical protein